MNQNTKELGTKPIGQLIAQYSIPAIIAMLVNAVYNVVDRVFIGNYVGEEALAGLTVAFPIMMIIFAFASLVGAGGAALISIKLGEKDNDGASTVFGNSLTMGFVITGMTLIAIFINLEGLLTLFGATPDILGYAADYMTIILCGFIFQMVSFVLNSTVRSEGNPMLPMAAMMVSAVTNMILDYFFIVQFGWGVEGAALATIAGQLTGLILLLSYYIRGKSQLKLRLRDFVPVGSIVGKILSIGFATFIGTIGNSVAMTFVNRGLGAYGGTAAITSMGAINSLFTFFIMPIMGMQQGLQPIMGYNHGARKEARVYKTLRQGIIVAIVFSTVIFAILQAFPKTFISLFLDPGSATVDMAVNGMRYYFLMLPVISINIFGVAFFQSTARAGTSLVLSMLRQFFLLIPLVLILPGFFGLNGIWAATPVSDGLSVLITLTVLVIDYRRHHKRMQNEDEQAKEALRA